jgi:hypothetical protein
MAAWRWCGAHLEVAFGIHIGPVGSTRRGAAAVRLCFGGEKVEVDLGDGDMTKALPVAKLRSRVRFVSPRSVWRLQSQHTKEKSPLSGLFSGSS